MSETILIIGSNRGIGLEMCKQLSARGAAVHATCRSESPELQAISGCTPHPGVDVTDRTALESLARALEPDSLDWLVVMSGILEPVSLDPLDLGAIERQLQVNAVGPLLATATLLGCLRRGARVGLVTSRMGSIADNTSGGSYGYRMSKAALNMAGRSLAHDLRPREIAVQLLHPGWVRTDMTGGSGQVGADAAAASLIDRMRELTAANTGRFVHANGDLLPW